MENLIFRALFEIYHYLPPSFPLPEEVSSETDLLVTL